jgi:hypothetical protein
MVANGIWLRREEEKEEKGKSGEREKQREGGRGCKQRAFALLCLNHEKCIGKQLKRSDIS